MQRFTRSTIIEPMTRVRRERLLPKQGEVVARVGHEVSPVQVVARAPREVDFYILPASDLLRVPPADLPKHLAVEPGMALEQGMPLVHKRGFLGRKELASPVDGILYEISNGRLIVQQTSDWVELRAMVQGRVINQIPNRGVVLEIHGSLVQAIWGSGKEGYGKIKVAAETADAPFTAEQMGPDVVGHILVVGKGGQLEAFQRAEESSVRGIIAGSITADIYQVASSFAFPVVVTDGIGDQSMTQPIFQLLQQAVGREVSLFGRAQDHGGNRPEIIIPRPATPGVEPPPSHKPLAVGQTVRLLRSPYNNQIGKVVRLYQRAKTTPIGTRAHGADVKLSDGHIVFVPYANLDAII
jgi:hypothetical protein